MLFRSIRDRSGEERIIEGEVKERQQARQMYESARNAGHVASLLEQERPNIFSQSIANIEPNAEVLIQISYVEMLQQVDGEYRFDFPMVVAPRYIPGRAIDSLGNRVGNGRAWRGNLPNELERREGVILLAPASFEQQKITMDGTIEQQNVRFDKQPLGTAPWLQQFINAAVPIQTPDGAYRQRSDVQALYQANPSYDFEARYADGTHEFGQIAGDGLGHVAGRWFYFDPTSFRTIEQSRARREGSFASDTDQVPDASRITPMPVRPTQRAGHDVSVKVNIDTGAGGPAIINWQSDLHAVECLNGPQYKNDGTKLSLALRNQNEIPNRDFVLRWKCFDESIQEAVFAHATPRKNDQAGGIAASGFFTAVIAPPTKVAPEHVLPRELIFVLDTSGSMQGAPIEKAKSVMSKAIDAMRPGDAFNVITFSGDTRILWKSPRSNSQANRDEAQAFLAAQSGGGGTEMMTAINAALTQTLDAEAEKQALTVAQLADLPADGRKATIEVDGRAMAVVLQDGIAPGVVDLRVRDDLAIRARVERWMIRTGTFDPASERRIRMVGEWRTENGQRIFDKVDAEPLPTADDAAIIEPLRIVMFLTDGQVGNDDAIIAAVREHSRTTRVFSFGIGDSPNRYLLDGIAQAGRGEAAYINLNNDAAPAVEAFAKRIEAPVLRDIELAFVGMGDDVEVFDTIPALDQIPDVWDHKPVIVHGRYRIKNGGAGGDAKPRSGKMVLKGKTASGEYLREINVSLPVTSDSHAMLPALWARGRIDQVLASDDGVRRGGSTQHASVEARQSIIALGEEYHITSAFTSFVAIEKARVTIAGRSVLVPIPIETPSGQQWLGVCGEDGGRMSRDVARALIDDAINGRTVTTDAALELRMAAMQEENDLQRRKAAERIGQWASQATDVQKQQAVSDGLTRVRNLQMQLKYDEALQVIDEILFIDEMNPSATALRELITTTIMYREYMDHVKIKELGFGQLSVDSQVAMTHPRKNLTGPGPKSVGGLVEYPVDWLADESLGERLAEYRATGVDFTNAPALDLDAALNAGSGGFTSLEFGWGEYGGAAQPYAVHEGMNGANADVYYAQVQQQFGDIDPASLARLGIVNVNSAGADVLATTPTTGVRAPGTDGMWDATVHAPTDATEYGYIARGESLSIDIPGGQLKVDPSTGKLNPSQDGGGGGGYGGGGSTGSGGSIFGEAVDEKARIAAELASEALDSRMADHSRRFHMEQERSMRLAQTREGINRAESLIAEQKLQEAGQVLDEVLFIDEQNAEALAYKNQLAATLVEMGRANAMGFNPSRDARAGIRKGIEPDRDLFATVIRVERTNTQVLAEIDVGEKDGVRKDWSMAIADGGKVVASLRIINVDVNRATGIVTLEDEKSRGLVRTGLRAIASSDEPAVPASALCEQLLEVVRDTVNPEDWREHGGTLAEVDVADCVFTFRSLSDAPEAAAMIDRARGFVMMLAAAIPEVSQIARVDQPPSKPFDIVKDAAAVAKQPPTDADDRAAMDAGLPPPTVLYVYDVRDLIDAIKASEGGEDASAEAKLLAIISEVVAPETWRDNGGRIGSMQSLQANLILTTLAATHREIERLLTDVRIVLAAREAKGMDAPNEVKPQVDGVFKGDLEGATKVDAKPAAEAEKPAHDLAESAIAAYDVRDMLQSLPAPAGQPLSRTEAVDQVCTMIRENIDPDGWVEYGGERGSIHEIADVLVIRNSAANHREIASLLKQAHEIAVAKRAKEASERKAKKDADRLKAKKALLQAMVIDRVRSVIDERLWPATFAKDDAIVEAARIVVLVNAIDDATIAQLEALGMRIDDRKAAMNLIAGEIADARKLVDVALLECVRRIEPIVGDK